MADPAVWPFVSVIILNFNGIRWLKECLDSLAGSDYPQDCYEVILGDNASTDDSLDFVRQQYPRVKTIAFDENSGFCRSNNRCAREARGEYLVFLNNDTFVTKAWLTELVRAVLADAKIVSCASKILFADPEKRLLNAAGGKIFISGSSIYEGWMQEDGPAYETPRDTGFGCAAGVLVQKRFFLETGGFDEYYFHSVEEMDLGWRAWLMGYKVRYVPTAVMYHSMGGTAFDGRGMTPSILFLVLRNSLYFIVKNFEGWTAVRGMALFFLKTLYTMGYALGTRNGAAFKAVWKALGHSLKDHGKAFRARELTQKLRKVKDRELQKRGVLAGTLEVVRATFAGLAAQQKYAASGLYDTKDIMKIRTNKQGNLVFYQEP